MRKVRGWLLGVAAGAFGCAACSEQPPLAESASGLHYVGTAQCRNCHQAQYEAWRGSHHSRAMQKPSAATVAGNFHGATFASSTTFAERDGRYIIRTPDAAGELTEFEVRYTFGVEPLQQYLLPLPQGRLQAFQVAWDTVRQRWFNLRLGELTGPDDALHWTAPAHNWNFMCADCHSTAVMKGYDPSTQTYDTTFAEVAVGCEACHGPGSAHASDPTKPLHPLAEPAAEQNACFPCHSRRSQLADGFRPNKAFLDHYAPALLESGLYHADGQILDEVYVYGSFVQSRMFAAGVTCSHCHEPHSAGLRERGNRVCTACHNETGHPDFPTLALGSYDSPTHHLHPQESTGARCVNCHMPARRYMVVDARRDHSLRVPRPDLNAATGAPDACTGCHFEREPAWAAAVLETAFGSKPQRHFGTVFANASASPAAAAALAAIANDAAQPAIVRATALARLANQAAAAVGDSALAKGLHDSDPLVRLGAVRGSARWPPHWRWQATHHLLRDDYLAVRSEAVPLLAPALNELGGTDRTLLQQGIAEYLEVQAFNADRPEAHTNVGNLHMASNALDEAEAAFAAALALHPNWVPALVNLADVYRATGRDGKAGDLLERAARAAPGSATVQLARAFWLVRQGQHARALPLFAAAAESAPEDPRTAYTYAIALHTAGRSKQALEVLNTALARHPGDAQLLSAKRDIAVAEFAP